MTHEDKITLGKASMGEGVKYSDGLKADTTFTKGCEELEISSNDTI